LSLRNVKHYFIVSAELVSTRHRVSGDTWRK